MKQAKTLLYFLGALQFLIFPQVANADDHEIEFSTFGRIVGGTFDQDQAIFNGYDESFTFESDSLAALRVDYQANNEWSFVVQAIAHSNDRKESGVQWLYADYRPNEHLSFKLGRQRIPFYLYSDVINVGFAYPWITPPAPVYSSYFFTEFDGASGRLSFSNNEISGSLESYYGVFDGTLETASNSTRVVVDYVYGFIAMVNVERWRYRLAYHIGQVDIAPDPQLQALIQALTSIGFSSVANDLNIDGAPEFIALGVDYENLNTFFRAELTNISAGDSIPFVPKQTGFYSTLGYNFYPFSAHITFSANRNRYHTPTIDIPFGLAPQIDQLASTISLVYDARPNDDLKSITLGLRYDVTSNIALKAEHTWLQGSSGGRALFEQIDLSKSKQEGQLSQFAVEWVF